MSQKRLLHVLPKMPNENRNNSHKKEDFDDSPFSINRLDQADVDLLQTLGHNFEPYDVIDAEFDNIVECFDRFMQVCRDLGEALVTIVFATGCIAAFLLHNSNIGGILKAENNISDKIYLVIYEIWNFYAFLTVLGVTRYVEYKAIGIDITTLSQRFHIGPLSVNDSELFCVVMCTLSLVYIAPILLYSSLFGPLGFINGKDWSSSVIAIMSADVYVLLCVDVQVIGEIVDLRKFITGM